ncbi:hypothetical protein LshimejAT787_1303090 [Lyophyllum shimeji]|uniref:Uncharacterized protein n=1 Tax=Lyophyllum shimeji TaxID=47721 RepID=A0A9P3PWS1_LYOSH|nr:hypothetical protein LshimejAT787_1303090 [Lyophyllum shimeji]
MMTPQEAATLQSIGRSLVRTFAAIVFETFLLALYSVSVVKACSILLRKGRTRVSLINLAIVIVLYLLAVSLFIIDIINYVAEVTTSFIHHPDVPIAQSFASARDSIFRLAAVIDALYAYMTILGDAVIVWRVYAFWGQGKRRWVLIIPWTILLGSLVTSALLTYCVAKLGTEIVDGAFKNPAFCRNIQTSSMAAATTLAATTLIGITTWEYRRNIKPRLGRSGRATRVEKILILLIESGFLYFLFFLAQVIGNTPRVSAAVQERADLTFSYLVFSYCSSVIVGMYPTLIIVLANSRRAVLDDAFSTSMSTWRATAPAAETLTSGWGSSQGRSTKVANEIELPTHTPTHDRDEPKAMLPF